MAFGDPERTRFAAAKPRPGKQSTGLFAWTGLSSPMKPQKKKPFSEEKGFGDPERTRTVDLQRDRLAC